MGRMQDQKVLVIVLGRVEAGQRLKLCHDRLWKNTRLIELGDIRLGDALLVSVRIEDSRAIRWSLIGALIIQFGRIVRNREINLQNLAVGNLLRIVSDLNRLGVTGPFGADHLVMGGFLLAAGIPGYGVDDPLGMLENTLHAPEAAIRQNQALPS